MEHSTLVTIIQHCDLAIERLRQAQVRSDVALALLDARMLLLQPEPRDDWDEALASLVEEGL